MTLKERFLKIKAAFDGTPPAPPAPPANPNPPAPPAGKIYKLQDGTEISISQAGDMPAAGDMVTINGAPAPANTYTLEDGSTIVVDATGMITVYTAAAAPPAPPAPAAPAAPPQPVTLSAMTAEQMTAMYTKFAGSVDDQIGALIIMVKALMEDRFGWKIREGQENAAIEVYKDTIASTPVVSIEQMNSAFAKADEQAKIIAKHEETIKGLFELIEKLVEMPGAEPITLTGAKKESFERAKKKEKYFEEIANSLKELKATK
jgi:hypothetical protein